METASLNTNPNIDVVTVLRTEFAKRCRTNPRYSLRAFSKSLSIDQSLLTKVLRGTRRLSAKSVLLIGQRLGLSPNQIEALTSTAPMAGKIMVPEYAQMAEDAFNVISDWYHFALLELIKVDGEQSDSVRMATRLGIHRTEVDDALARLERLGYLSRNGINWELKSPNNSWSSGDTTAARHNLQKILAQKNLAAIDDVDFKYREHGSLTIACDEALLPEIRKRFKKFRQELDAFTQAHGNYNQVYQVMTSFYPLTRRGEENRI